MKRRGTVVVMYDAPPALDGWMHGPHYDEVMATPGVVAVRRYEVLEGPADARRYVALIETEDVDATLAWRNSADGQRSQKEANDNGVANRYGMICKPIYSSVPGEMD